MMRKDKIKRLCIEAHDHIVEQRRRILKLELALTLALITLENSDPGSQHWNAANAIRNAVKCEHFPPRPRTGPTLVVDNDMEAS